MLENKKLNMIISLLIAVALWAFVIGEVNPETSRSYRDVPIRFINQETLEQNSMAVYSISERTIHATLRGTRSEINKIDEKDIIATVDLDGAVMGENQLRVDLRVSGKAEIETQSVDKVTVVVEPRVSREIPVEVSYEGIFNGEEEPITLEQDCSTVVVYGAETIVGQVVAAKASVPENSIKEDVQEVLCSLYAVNSAGQRVYNVTLSDKDVRITSELAKLKTVPLRVPIEGEDSNGIERTVATPEKITIKGRMADLESIDVIFTETLHLDHVLSSTNIPLVPILPEGVELSEASTGLEAAVQVTKTETQTLTFDQTKVELRGLEEGFTAELVNAAIEVTLTGSESILETLTKDDISLYADLSGHKAGRYKVILQAVCTADEPAVTISPKKITVIIKAEETGEMPVQPEEDKDSPDQNDDNKETETDNNHDNSEE